MAVRIFEVAFIIFTSSASVCWLSGRWQKASCWLLICALGAVVAHVIFEGAHWQMAPAYAAAIALCFVVWRRTRMKGWSPVILVLATMSLTALSVLFSFLLPMFVLPRPTGPYPVGTKILYLRDTALVDDEAPVPGSPRELMVQLWYPALPSRNRFARYRQFRETTLVSSYQSVLATHSRMDVPVAAAGAPFPVILMNHAWHGRRTNDTFLVEELASHGYVVASIDHTYNASLVGFPDGRVIHGHPSTDIDLPDLSSSEQVRATWDKELVKWTADQEFVLNYLAAMNRSSRSPWFRRLNTEDIGAIGHSFGGAAATQLGAADRRVRASVNMDGWFFGAIRKRGPNQPLLIMNSYDPSLPVDPNAKVLMELDSGDFTDTSESLREFGGYRVVVCGAGHTDFTDQSLISPLRVLSHRGTISAAKVQTIVRSYVLAFFDQALRDNPSQILQASARPYSEAVLETWPSDNSASDSSAPREVDKACESR